MGPLPKRRHSTGRGGRRQSQIKQKTQTLVKCWNCGAMRQQHIVCPACGAYRPTK